MERPIRLRIFGFSRHGKYYTICLETYTAVRGNSFDESKRKMADALTIYMRSFSEKELSSGAYIRRAPIQFRVAWNVFNAVGSMNRAILTLSSFIADYDPHSEHLSLA